MVRGSGSPISTFKCISLSEPLTRSAERNRPKERSTLRKSSRAMRESGFDAFGELEARESLLHGANGLRGDRDDSGVAVLGNLTAAILIDHGEGAAGEIAQAVGQIGVVAAHQRVVAEAAVLPEHDFTEQ